MTVTLPNSVIQALTGSAYMPAAYLLHLMTGLLAFPAGWMFVAQPIAQRLAPALPRMLVAVVYGALLWVFALYVMAHLGVGLPAFLGFSSVAWVALVALVAHVLLACVVAAVVHWRDNEQAYLGGQAEGPASPVVSADKPRVGRLIHRMTRARRTRVPLLRAAV